MNRHKVHHPIGFFDQYAELAKNDQMLMTFLTQMQSELYVRDNGMSIFLTPVTTGAPVRAVGHGISIFVTKDRP